MKVFVGNQELTGGDEGQVFRTWHGQVCPMPESSPCEPAKRNLGGSL